MEKKLAVSNKIVATWRCMGPYVRCPMYCMQPLPQDPCERSRGIALAPLLSCVDNPTQRTLVGCVCDVLIVSLSVYPSTGMRVCVAVAHPTYPHDQRAETSRLCLCVCVALARTLTHTASYRPLHPLAHDASCAHNDATGLAGATIGCVPVARLRPFPRCACVCLLAMSP